MERYTDTVCGVDGEMKIRDYLKRRLGLSTALIAKVKYDNVLLNGEIVYMRAMVKNGDVIDITLPDEDSENIEPMDIKLDIVYEDRHDSFLRLKVVLKQGLARFNDIDDNVGKSEYRSELY